MKKLFLVVTVLLAFSQSTFSQSTEMAEGDSIPWELRKQSFIYNSSRMFNDTQVSKMALYNLISENPSNFALYDSLSLIYLQFNQFASAALVAQRSLQLNPQNLFATEVAATSFDNLGVRDKAIPYYETLYLSNNDLNILYKISFLQLELERFGESITSVDIILNHADAEKSNIVFPTQDNAGQEVTLKVAAHRVKAMVAESQGKEDEAKQLYLKTLEMHPGFEVVQSQLQALNKKD